MATRLAIITSARLELQEATAGFWAATELVELYDLAHQEIVEATRQEATATLTLVDGTESYTLPADFFLARRVEIQTTVGSSIWAKIPATSLDMRRAGDLVNASGGAPSGYFIFANKIYFVPLPDSAYTGTLFYYKNATVSTADGDTPSYPSGIAQVRVDRAIKLYICANALRKRQDGSYTTYAGDYNAELRSLVLDALSRGSNADLQIVDDWHGE